ncbi:hypothetical protein ACWCQQ_49930, partial [Streptomyces sp. NPDC002143]
PPTSYATTASPSPPSPPTTRTPRGWPPRPSSSSATTGRFGTTDLQGRLSTFSRIVYTIGQETDYPGGAAALLGSATRLTAVLGPDGVEVNGLGDAQRTLRVLGAASVTPGVLRLTGTDQAVLTDRTKQQADVLPPDARAIHPSIRYHAGRIAEMNRTLQR